MEETHNTGVTLDEVEIPPTEDELPYSDGIPMESERHVLQMYLLILPLRLFWKDREFFVGGNMFIYFSLKQLRHQDFRGPDVFVVLDVPKRERKSWVVWQEGKGPDVVIELLSESTAGIDKGEKMRVYQDQLKVTEYFWYDPFTGELAGFQLQGGVYVPIEPDVEGGLVSKRLGLKLVKWEGKYAGVEAVWLRWAKREGELLPTEEELAEQERQRAEQERQRAEQAEQLARQQKQRADELEALLARYRERFGEMPE